MSSRHYPRYDSRKRLAPHTHTGCMAKGCGQKAQWQVFVQFSYFRGEDGDYLVCEEHRKFANPDHLDDWIEQMEDRA